LDLIHLIGVQNINNKTAPSSAAELLKEELEKLFYNFTSKHPR
jgi:hypothetical protein